MFRKPTKRSITRARRFTFHDAPMPMSSGDATIPIPPDWVGRDLVDLVGELVEQGNERMFYGAIEPTPRTLGNIGGVKSEDQMVPMQSDWQDAKARVRDAAPVDLPASVSPDPDGDPESTTTGGTAGPGMMGECVAVFPTGNNRYAYWTQVKPDSLCVIRRDFGDDAAPAIQVGEYPMTPDAYYSFDVSTTQWRLFRTNRQQADMGDTRPGLRAGRANARAANDSAAQINAINKANRDHWRR